jgi:L-arabinose isomerase
MAPFQLSEAVGTPLGPCISRHFNNRKPGCLDATIKIGLEVTVFRLWVMEGRYHLLVLEGATIRPKRHLLGNNGLVQFGPGVDLEEGFQRWVERGFPHHVCVVEGHHRRQLAQFARDHGVVVMV